MLSMNSTCNNNDKMYLIMHYYISVQESWREETYAQYGVNWKGELSLHLFQEFNNNI